MSVIVSANYRDRSQKNWLVRHEGEPLESYELRERVVLKNFCLCDSSSEEAGFGCSVVAVGEMAEESEVNKESLVPIFFQGIRFYEKLSDAPVNEGSVLVLDATGMYYVPS